MQQGEFHAREKGGKFGIWMSSWVFWGFSVFPSGGSISFGSSGQVSFVFRVGVQWGSFAPWIRNRGVPNCGIVFLGFQIVVGLFGEKFAKGADYNETAMGTPFRNAVKSGGVQANRKINFIWNRIAHFSG